MFPGWILGLETQVSRSSPFPFVFVFSPISHLDFLIFLLLILEFSFKNSHLSFSRIMEPKQFTYHPLMSESRDFESITEHDQEDTSNDERILSRHQRLCGWVRHITSPVLIALIALCLLVCALIVAVLTKLNPSDLQCSKQLSSWCKCKIPVQVFEIDSNFNAAPALDAVEYIEYDFDGAFNATSIYRGPPTEERESAWFNLTYSKI